MMGRAVFSSTMVLLFAVGSVACGSDDDSPGGGGGSGGGGNAAGIGGSGGTGGAAGAGGSAGAPDTTAPQMSNVTFVENPKNHLSGWIELDTDEAADVTVSFSDDENNTFNVPVTSNGTTHSIPILGLRPEHVYAFSVTATDASANASTDDTQTYTPIALAADFPPVTSSVSDPTKMEAGVTVFNVFRFNPGVDETWGYLIAVDEAGDVVWYHTAPHSIYEVVRLANGNFVWTEGHEAIVEVDIMGTEVNRWTTSELSLDTFHHETYEMDNGNILTLSTELRTVGADDFVGDLLVEIDTATHTVAHSYSTFDLLDTTLSGAGHDGPFWDSTYPDATNGTKDWTHGNAIIYDASDDSYIVSIRHLDRIIKVDRATGALKWELGEGGDFTMNGTGLFQFHQHAPELQADGSLLIYDNGNARTGTDPTQLFTRVVQFDIDEVNMTVDQVWEYRGESQYYAQYVGDADRMNNGNVLICDGGLVSDPTLGVGDPTNKKLARIREVTHEATPEVVFEVNIEDTAATDPVSYAVYRAERWPSLYQAAP